MAYRTPHGVVQISGIFPSISTQPGPDKILAMLHLFMEIQIVPNVNVFFLATTFLLEIWTLVPDLSGGLCQNIN